MKLVNNNSQIKILILILTNNFEFVSKLSQTLDLQILSWLVHVPRRRSLLVLRMRERLRHHWFSVQIWLDALAHAARVYTVRALVNAVLTADITAVTIFLLQSGPCRGSRQLILDVLALSWRKTVLLPDFLHFKFHFIDVSLNVIFRRTIIWQSGQSFSLLFSFFSLLLVRAHLLVLRLLLVLLVLHLNLILLILLAFTL